MKKILFLLFSNFFLISLNVSILGAYGDVILQMNGSNSLNPRVAIDQPNGCMSILDIRKDGVLLKGSVVRFYAKVLDVNIDIRTDTAWLRLSDTGCLSFDTHSIIVKTNNKFLPKIGETIYVEGVVTLNVTRSHGYFFPILIENAVFYKDLIIEENAAMLNDEVFNANSSD